MFSSFTDAALSTFRWWIIGIAIVGSLFAITSAILTGFINQELARRSGIKSSVLEVRLNSSDAELKGTQAKLRKTEQEASAAKQLALELQQKAADREITPVQCDMLRAHLASAGWNLKTPVKIFVQDADAEADKYSKLIKAALDKAGVGFVVMQSNGGWVFPRGLSIAKGDSPESSVIVEALKTAFTATSIQIEYAPEDTLSKTSLVFLFVGSKN